MVGVVSDRKTSIVTDLAEWHIGGTDPTVGKFALTSGNSNRNAGISLGIRIGTTRQYERTISAPLDIDRDMRAWYSVRVGNRMSRGRRRRRHFELMMY
jgi:hypothetical protein